MGRPRKYNDVEKMQKDIDNYFDMCDKEGKPYTMSGLALFLNMDRKSLLNYSKDEKYFPTIKKARNRVETFVEESLFKYNTAGVIFNLKNNFGWEDKQEIKQQVDMNMYANLTEEELKKLAK